MFGALRDLKKFWKKEVIGRIFAVIMWSIAIIFALVQYIYTLETSRPSWFDHFQFAVIEIIAIPSLLSFLSRKKSLSSRSDQYTAQCRVPTRVE